MCTSAPCTDVYLCFLHEQAGVRAMIGTNWFQPVHLAAEGGWEDILSMLLDEGSVRETR
jgi:hypothetical protein